MMCRSLVSLASIAFTTTLLVACSSDDAASGPDLADSGTHPPGTGSDAAPGSDGGIAADGASDLGDYSFGGRVSDNPSVQIGANGRHKSWRDGLPAVPGVGNAWWMPTKTIKYPKGQVHSPLTRDIAHHLRTIV